MAAKTNPWNGSHLYRLVAGSIRDTIFHVVIPMKRTKLFLNTLPQQLSESLLDQFEVWFNEAKIETQVRIADMIPARVVFSVAEEHCKVRVVQRNRVRCRRFK